MTEHSGEKVVQCSRCGSNPVVNGHPNDDIVVCEDCSWNCALDAVLEIAEVGLESYRALASIVDGLRRPSSSTPVTEDQS